MRALDAKVAQCVISLLFSLFHQQICGDKERCQRQKPHTHCATNFKNCSVSNHKLGDSCEMRLFHLYSSSGKKKVECSKKNNRRQHIIESGGGRPEST